MALDLLPYLAATAANSSATATLGLTVATAPQAGAAGYAWPALPGDTIIACGGSGGAQPTTVTDSQSHAYTKRAGTSTAPASSIWTATAANGLQSGHGPRTSADTATVTYAATGTAKQWIFLGCQNLGAFDVAATPATGTSAAPATGTAAPTQAGDLVIALIVAANATGGMTGSWPAGWHEMARNVTSGTTNAYASVAVKVAADTSTQSCTVALSASGNWTAELVCMKAAAQSLRANVGASIFSDPYGLSLDNFQSHNHFNAVVGRTCNAIKRFLGEDVWPSQGDDKEQVVQWANEQGCLCVVCVSPRRAIGGGTETSRTNMRNAILYWKDNGVAPQLILVNEATGWGSTGAFGNGTNRDYGFGTPYASVAASWGQNYKDFFKFYAPTIVSSGLQAQYNAVMLTQTGSLTAMPARTQADGWPLLCGLSIDYYCYNDYEPSKRNTMADLMAAADAMTPPCPVGAAEIGTSNAAGIDVPGNNPAGSLAKFVTWLNNQMTAPFAARLSAGKQNLPVIWFSGGPNSIIDTGDTSLIAAFDALFDAIDPSTAGGAVQVTTTALPAGIVGTAYSATLTATGGTPGYTWAVTVGTLPAGLTLHAATGVIDGTPTTAAVSSFTVQATDSLAATATAALAITITAALAITTTALPAATTGSAYSQALAATGGTAPYTWAVTTGTLPDGLALDPAAGVISGTPTAAAATSGFTVTVTDAGSLTAAAALFITVVAGLPPPNPAPNPLGFPQVAVEAGLNAAAPQVPAGTFLLDDPVYGKLDTGKLGDATTWTDITGYFRSGTISRPSTRVQGPLITWQGGTATGTFDNTTGALDPDNPSGPYAGLLRPMVPFRVRAVYGSVSYPIWKGFAGSWQGSDLTYDMGYDETTITADDGFKILAGITIPAIPSTSDTPGAGDGEDTGARVTRILNAAAWYTDHRRITTGDSAVQGTLFGDTALNLLQLTADNEIGSLYIDGMGNLVFRHRQALLEDARSAQVQAVFGDLPGTVHGSFTELACIPHRRASDDTTLCNDVQATTAGGTLQRAQNKASQRTYLFPRSYARTDLILQDDAAALAWAQWVLTVSKDMDDRFDAVTIDPLADPANLYPQVLGREIGDRIQVWRRPQNSGQTITQDCFIRGITHNVDAVAGTWSTTWDLQSAARYTGFLILDDPVNGKLDTGKLAF